MGERLFLLRTMGRRRPPHLLPPARQRRRHDQHHRVPGRFPHADGRPVQALLSRFLDVGSHRLELVRRGGMRVHRVEKPLTWLRFPAASARTLRKLANRIYRHTTARTASEARSVSRYGGSLPTLASGCVRKLTRIATVLLGRNPPRQQRSLFSHGVSSRERSRA